MGGWRSASTPAIGAASPNHRLPALEVKLGYRPLTAAQRRELRAQWLAARVILNDFAERRCCSREIVINRYVNLDELISILCAAVAFSDDEHLWRLALPDGTRRGRPVGPADHAQGARAETGPAVLLPVRLRRQLAIPRAPAPDPRGRRPRPVGTRPAHRHARRPVRRLGQGARAIPGVRLIDRLRLTCRELEDATSRSSGTTRGERTG